MATIKPLIAVLPLLDQAQDSQWMRLGYFDGIQRAGGIPVMPALTEDEGDITQLAGLFDGYLFSGGPDIGTAFYGMTDETGTVDDCPIRDSMEFRLLQKVIVKDRPILGICRGIQLINVALGGTLYQDLATQHPSEINHIQKHHGMDPEHLVKVNGDSALGKLLGMETMEVNSFHHQAIRDMAPGLKAMAWSPDGLVEAVEMPGQKFMWAVQWHPELSQEKDPKSQMIFKAFVDSCRP